MSDTIGLGLQEREVEEILLKVDVNSDQKVVFAEFLPLCKELLCAIYAKLNVETVVRRENAKNLCLSYTLPLRVTGVSYGPLKQVATISISEQEDVNMKNRLGMFLCR